MAAPSSSPIAALVAARNLPGFNLKLRDDKFAPIVVTENNPMFMLSRIDRADIELSVPLIDNDDNMINANVDAIAVLRSALGAMTSLKSLRLQGSFGYRRREPPVLLSVPKLTALLTSVSTIDTLRFVTVAKGLVLRGTKADYRELARILSKHNDNNGQEEGKKKRKQRKWENLLSIEMSATFQVVDANGDDVRAAAALDPLMKALTTLPKLHYMELCNGGNIVQFTSRHGIQTLFASPYITSLDLSVHGFDKVCEVAQSLQSNSVVTRLKLTVHPSSTATTDSAEAEGRAAKAIKELLRHNRTLYSVTLHIHMDVRLDEESLIAIMQGLAQATVKSVDIQLPQAPPTSSPLFQETARSLEKNVYLEDFCWRDSSRPRTEQQVLLFVELDLILKLNKAGRKFLVGNNLAGNNSLGGPRGTNHGRELTSSRTSTSIPSRRQWIRTLSAVGDCLDSVFYLLTMNPEWVFATETLRPTSPDPSRKRTFDNFWGEDFEGSYHNANENNIHHNNNNNKRRKVTPVKQFERTRRQERDMLNSMDPVQRAFVESILQENETLKAEVKRLKK